MVNKKAKKLLLPQEVETFYIIPTIRKCFAKELMKDGMKQKDIAELFGVTKAAVSQYLSRKRGNELKFEPRIMKEIVKSAEEITNTYSYLRETEHILQYIRRTSCICKFHRMFSTIPLMCNPEAMGCWRR